METTTKNRIELKYTFYCEPDDLFYALYHREFMSNWLAERVDHDRITGIYTFHWSDFSESARITELDKDELKLRWEWVDGDHDRGEYISFRVGFDEVDEYVDLFIEDFCDPGDEENYRDGWDKMMLRLSRAIL